MASLELQLKAVHEFLNGNDIFISMPTGYGKHFVYYATNGF